MGACLLLGQYLLFEWQWPLFSILLPIGIGFVVVAVMERLQPYRPAWNKPEGDVATDLIYAGVNSGLRELLSITFTLALLALATQLNWAEQGLGFWPASWHPLLQLVLALLIFDLFEYGFHRASHRYRFLWRFHAIHHSPKRLYFLNAARFHALEWTVLTLIELAVLSALGARPEIIALAVVFIQVHGLFQHANIDIKLGPLNYLVSGPELHRWHHSQIITESDQNFGNNVIVWDLLFGTYFLPKNRSVGTLGLLNPDYPTGFFGQLRAAFAKRPLDKPADYYQAKVDK